MKARRPRYTPEAAARIRKLHPLIKKEIRKAIRSLLVHASAPAKSLRELIELAKANSISRGALWTNGNGPLFIALHNG